MNAEQYIEKHEHNQKSDEEEIERIKAELEMATERIAYFENIINSAAELRKLAEVKILETESKKLDTITNKLSSQIQSIGELVRKAESRREEAVNKMLDAEVRLIMVENRILHARVANF